MNKGSTSKALDNLKWLLAMTVFGIAVVGNSYFVEVAFLYRVLGVLFLFLGCCPALSAMANGHGQWPWPMTMANGHGQ